MDSTAQSYCNMDASGSTCPSSWRLTGYGIGEADKSIDQINKFTDLLPEASTVSWAFAVSIPQEGCSTTYRASINTMLQRTEVSSHPVLSDGEESYRVLEKAQELGIPYIHTGQSRSR